MSSNAVVAAGGVAKPRAKPSHKRSVRRISATGYLLTGDVLVESVYGQQRSRRDFELARRRMYRRKDELGLFKLGPRLLAARTNSLEQRLAELEKRSALGPEPLGSSAATTPDR